jgi:hypothetical protein
MPTKVFVCANLLLYLLCYWCDDDLTHSFAFLLIGFLQCFPRLQAAGNSVIYESFLLEFFHSQPLPGREKVW